MLRSIVVALDSSPSSVQAGAVAVDLARRTGAHLTGLCVVNSAWIQRPEPVPIGGAAYKRASEQELLHAAHARTHAVRQDFESSARAAGLASYEARETEGDPCRVIAREATDHDLVVVGRDSMFDVEGDPAEFPVVIDRLIRNEPRPVLLLPHSETPGPSPLDGPALVAFDGSAASSRALHMFALLGLGRGRPVHVLTIDEASKRDAEATAAQGCRLLSRHGATEVDALGLGEAEAGSAAETILGTAAALEAGLLAIGAYGHRGFREIFGSCTRAVLQNCRLPLFLHH